MTVRGGKVGKSFSTRRPLDSVEEASGFLVPDHMILASAFVGRILKNQSDTLAVPRRAGDVKPFPPVDAGSE